MRFDFRTPGTVNCDNYVNGDSNGPANFPIGIKGVFPTATTSLGMYVDPVTGLCSVGPAGGGGGSPNLTWIDSPSTTQPMAPGFGYFAVGPGLTTFTLPSTAPAQGTYFAVAGSNAGGWEIHQNANQQILFASTPTTVGTAGKVGSGVSPYTSLTLVYKGVISGVETWQSIASVGALAWNS